MTFSMRSWKNAGRKIIIEMHKKTIFLLLAGLILLAACKNPDEDTLLNEVNDGHNAGMARMGRLTRAQQEATRLLDSLNKLPAKARQAAGPYKTKLESLLRDLDYADFSMNKWMSEFNWDSSFANARGKISYLQTEKEKVTKVKEAIISSLQKADSLLDRRF